ARNARTASLCASHDSASPSGSWTASFTTSRNGSYARERCFLHVPSSHAPPPTRTRRLRSWTRRVLPTPLSPPMRASNAGGGAPARRGLAAAPPLRLAVGRRDLVAPELLDLLDLGRAAHREARAAVELARVVLLLLGGALRRGPRLVEPVELAVAADELARED